MGLHRSGSVDLQLELVNFSSKLLFSRQTRTQENNDKKRNAPIAQRLCVTSAPAAVTYYYATAYGVSKAASGLG